MEQVNIGTQNDDTSQSQPPSSSRNRPTSTTSSIMAIGPGTLSKSDEHYEERSLKLKDLINAASSSSDDDENSADQVLPPPAVGNSPGAEEEEDSDTAGVTATMNNTLHNSSSIFAAATILDDSPTSVASLDSDDNLQSVHRLREQQDTATRHQQQPPRAGLFPSSSSSWRDKPRSPPRVSFYPSIQCRPYISHRDYTHEEYEATWRTEVERVEAQDEVLETVRIMRDRIRLYQQHQEQEEQQQRAVGISHDDSDAVRPFWFVDTPTHTSRGIEHMRTKQDVRKRRERKRTVVAAVLYQQHLLRSSNLHDSVSLAQTSHSVSRTSKKLASAVALRDARHSDEVRDGLLKRYASAAMRLSQLDAEALASLDQDSDDEDANDDDSNSDMEDSFAAANQGQGDEDDELNRSSALSFEKHDGVVCEELNSLVDDNTTEIDKDTTTETNTEMEKDAVSVISKFEVCVLDAEVLAGKISVNISDAKTTGIVEASLGNNKTAVVDRFGNKLLYRQPSTRSRSARQQRSSYHFNRSSGGVVASMA